MKIRIAGYQLTFRPNMNIDTLFQELQANQWKKFTYSPHQRVLYVARDGGYILGCLLTDRGHKNFLAIDSHTNQVTRGTLGQSKNFGAFNFFVLCKSTNTALITTYRDAGGPSFVFGALEKFGNEVLQKMGRQEIAAAGGGLTKKQKAKIHEAHSPPCFVWVEKVGKETYEAVLGRWGKIRAIEIVYEAAGQPQAFIPYHQSPFDSKKVRLAFTRKTPVRRAIDTLKGLMRLKEVNESDTINIDGTDEWGIARRVELQDRIPSLFGELDHDVVIADPTSFDLDLKKSFVIRHLKEVIRNAPTIFG